MEYNVLAEKKYKIGVYSCVIYTEKAHQQACSPYIKTLPNGILVYEFRFGNINLQDLNTKELIQRKQSGLLPLLPLTRQGHDLDAIDRMITQLHEKKDTELLALALAMASICLEEDANATAWLQRRQSMLSEEDFTNNWFIQGFLNKGLAQGKAEGKAQGKAEGLQQYLVSLTQARFPELLTLAGNNGRAKVLVCHRGTHRCDWRQV